ncbi:hypothetical protein RFI_04875 [Reticulomyxa filosa]|uniref:Uncharacterized protein n=1 Tax=Reticulomyxa filosa TaxID=46433 RepID=X6P1Y8_RETFI|nr:hypothetical protein RFI_04875 [Reticulomyxa filosa]|eukprot:ETO32241.1 hypothetical protein RFI_04875 [Reticulomyxa filosa]
MLEMIAYYRYKNKSYLKWLLNFFFVPLGRVLFFFQKKVNPCKKIKFLLPKNTFTILNRVPVENNNKITFYKKKFSGQITLLLFTFRPQTENDRKFSLYSKEQLNLISWCSGLCIIETANNFSNKFILFTYILDSNKSKAIYLFCFALLQKEILKNYKSLDNDNAKLALLRIFFYYWLLKQKRVVTKKISLSESLYQSKNQLLNKINVESAKRYIQQKCTWGGVGIEQSRSLSFRH